MAKIFAAAVRAKIAKEWVIDRSSKLELRREWEFASDDELMLALAKDLSSLAIAPISKYKVPIVGLERETGDLLIGANLEFAGATLGQTVHAEQFLFARAFHRGTSIASFALAEPTPCGHCRQFILEFSEAKNMRVLNSMGLNGNIEDLTPRPFGPEQLNAPGIRADRQPHRLHLPKNKSGELWQAALGAAMRSYCPYSKTPAGVALQTKSGGIFSGSYIENAAFNPSLPPLQSALINLVAGSARFRDIVRMALVQKKGSIDSSESTKSLLKAISPKARFNHVEI